MKKIILPLVLVLVLVPIIAFVLLYSHWDHSRNMQKLEAMKNYASEKYGQEFTVEYFLPARDSSYTSKLTLSNGKYQFNVFHEDESGGIYDDLPDVVVNHILTDYIRDTVDLGGTDFVLYGNFMIANSPFRSFSYDQLEALSPQEILEYYNIYNMMKVILIVKTTRSIPQQADDLFALYHASVALQPKYLDFEVIQVKGESKTLEKMLNNLTGYYSRRWKSYPVIKDCLRITDLEIQSATQLLENNEYNP